MDLKQTKLTKTEWNNTEVPINETEKFILDVINKGYNDVDIRRNMNKSMLEYIKIENTSENESFLYEKYFEKEISAIIKKYKHLKDFSIKTKKNQKKPKKADVFRIENTSNHINSVRDNIFEFVLIGLCNDTLKHIASNSKKHGYYLYTLLQLKKSSISNINSNVLLFVNNIIDFANNYTKIDEVISSAYDFIEKNPNLLKYEDITLFPHQKELFTIFQNPNPKLVLYIAPTGTGKTLSPIGLSSKYKVIFICVSRHVGLALAKSSISMEKKIAFAFGCETASDIRLHYFAASSYQRNKRTGGIGKVDNSVGDKVEIMICDVQSYLTAMYYMLAFNDESEIVTYWDEPTITMDYENHELHDSIHKNWKENKISKMVLSCATLPREEEIQDTILDFKCKFDNSEIYTINSYDFKKSITLLDKECYCIVPHLLYENHNDLLTCIYHCENNKTLLRYFDLNEIINFIVHVNNFDLVSDDYKINSYFGNIIDITMDSIKIYYLKLLKKIDSDKWRDIHLHLKCQQKNKFMDKSSTLKRVKSMEVEKKYNNIGLTKTKSVDSKLDNTEHPGLLITTRDAHTLTDGPTIFMANDVKKIGMFYLQVSKIPAAVLKSIMDRIGYNNNIQQKMDKLQRDLDFKLNKDDDDEKHTKKNERKQENDPEIRKISNEIDNLRLQIQDVSLDKIFVPNTKEHQDTWTNSFAPNAFAPNIDESMIKKIMELDVDDVMKILLMLGIGTFDNDVNMKYLEIMKELAYDQKLYVIIASTDYIYGTNYSFCHGYIGKDLTNMTQQKIIQAMGRIGRNKIQQDYTIRFRDDTIVQKLFQPIEENLEAINMSKLFNSD